MDEKEFKSPSRNHLIGSPINRSFAAGTLSNALSGAVSSQDEVHRLRKQVKTNLINKCSSGPRRLSS